MAFVVVLGQGRSGSTLIMRLLNAVPGVYIAGENHRAFDHLSAFQRCIIDTRNDRNEASFYSIAWMAPPGADRLVEHMRSLVLSLYNPRGESAICGFKRLFQNYGKYLLILLTTRQQAARSWNA
jgi:hypothetical protein